MKLKYIPALDGLRALSILFVVLFHWPYSFLTTRFGWIGVNIFFVLSGFLITSILLRQKNEPLKPYLFRFYKNRTLRIFPLYYLYLALTLFILIVVPLLSPDLVPEKYVIKDLATVKFDVLYVSTYLYNFTELFRVLDQQGNNEFYSFVGHFWSLAVEEQYYLIFPLVVYLLPERALKWVFVATILLTPPLRLVAGEMIQGTQYFHFFKYSITKLPFFHLDAFAIGGILYFLPLNKLKFPLTLLAFYTILCAAFGLLAVASLNRYQIFIGWDTFGFDSPLFQYGLETPETWLNVRYAFTFTIVNIGAGLLILALLSKNWLTSLFSHPTIAFFGRISYGMYILHMPLMAILNYHFLNTGITLSFIQETILFLAFYLILTVISWLSFTYFESYFLRLKHRQPHHSA